MSTSAFIGLGANLADPGAQVLRALDELAHLPRCALLARSSLWRSAPVGYADQPEFINAVVELQTRLAPRVLLNYLLEIETRFGRDRSESEKWGPRELDLDLLTFGDESIDEPGMHIPHPHLHERAFVLVPLAEIAPSLKISGVGIVSELLASVSVDGIEAIE